MFRQKTICVGLLLIPTCIYAHSAFWHPPVEGVVLDGPSAISVARIVWFSMHPGLPKSSDAVWQKNMDVSLQNGVWKVSSKPLGVGSIGGSLEIDILKRDGRVIGIYMTQ